MFVFTLNKVGYICFTPSWVNTKCSYYEFPCHVPYFISEKENNFSISLWLIHFKNVKFHQGIQTIMYSRILVLFPLIVCYITDSTHICLHLNWWSVQFDGGNEGIYMCMFGPVLGQLSQGMMVPRGAKEAIIQTFAGQA